ASLTDTLEVNTHTDAEVRRVLDPLSRIAASTGCAILAIMHPPKRAAGLDKMYQVSGSGAYTAVARSVLVVELAEGGFRTVEVAKASFHKRQTLKFKLDYVPIPGLKKLVPKITWVMPSRLLIRAAICRGGYLTKADICRITGLDQKTVEYHVKTLWEDGEIHLGEKRGRADTFGCGPSPVLDRPAAVVAPPRVVLAGEASPEEEEESLKLQLAEAQAAGLA